MNDDLVLTADRDDDFLNNLIQDSRFFYSMLADYGQTIGVVSGLSVSNDFLMRHYDEYPTLLTGFYTNVFTEAAIFLAQVLADPTPLQNVGNFLSYIADADGMLPVTGIAGFWMLAKRANLKNTLAEGDSHYLDNQYIQPDLNIFANILDADDKDYDNSFVYPSYLLENNHQTAPITDDWQILNPPALYVPIMVQSFGKDEDYQLPPSAFNAGWFDRCLDYFDAAHHHVHKAVRAARQHPYPAALLLLASLGGTYQMLDAFIHLKKPIDASDIPDFIMDIQPLIERASLLAANEGSLW